MATRPFVVSAIQTAISINYRNDRLSFIADDVMPRVGVGSSRFKWNYLPIGQAFTVPQTEVGRLGRLERVEFTGEERSEETRDYGLESPIPEQDIRDAHAMLVNGQGNFDPLNNATEMLTDLILIDREIRVAARAQDPDSYAPGNRQVLSGSSQFSDPTSDPIGILKAAFDGTTVFRPNTMTLGRPVWSKLSSHPQIVNAIKGNVTSKGIITPEQFVELFRGEGLTKLNIGEAFLNTARPGQSPTLSRIWGRHIALHYINPAARPQSGATWGMTAQWGTRVAGTVIDPFVGLDGATIARVGERVREIVTAPEAGYLIQNAVAA